MRSLRNLLLHVDGSEHALERLKFAQAIAQPCSARITALYAVTPWLMLYPGPLEGMSPAYTVLSEEDAEKRNRAKAAFQAAATGMGNVDWLEGALTSPYEFGNNALYADLMVLGQKIRSNRDVPDDFIPSVIMDSGKPAIIVPTGVAHMPVPLNSVLIAWNASRESARALCAAWPLLTEASEVHVAIFGDPTGGPTDSIKLEHYLRQHDVKPRFHLSHATKDPGASLLSLAAELGVDLLVMGCYGHSRAREWVLGGATRTVLREMSLPVLMAH
ncbi:MAG: universal stress protein [Aquabacterium sp.]|uniref:universal stress protein n=1 Tax=Aquabacterium sp. TaxID=1872578 RepID=UPI002722BBAC|nr:universal stress protein [Aquabacterium sp.]MDO9005811.1 universal stress protein [Aquabacterium sp.]